MKHVLSSMKLIRESQYIPVEAKREFDETMPLIRAFEQLGPNARRVLLALADRLVKGIEHGDFDKPHDWDKESADEALDLAVYQAAKLLGLGKAEEPKYKPSEAFKEAVARGVVLQTAREYTAPDGTRVSLDGRTSDGRPWVPPVGARVRVVFQPDYGLTFGDDRGRTLTVKRVKQVQEKNAGGIVEIVFEEHEGRSPRSRDVRVVPA